MQLGAFFSNIVKAIRSVIFFEIPGCVAVTFPSVPICMICIVSLTMGVAEILAWRGVNGCRIVA